VKSVYNRTGCNKDRIARAIEKLFAVRVIRDGVDRGPIVESVATSQPLGSRSDTRYILREFDEPLADRVWFGSTLVDGVASFRQPLRELLGVGDDAARVLMEMYLHNEPEVWGGVSPQTGLWVRYVRAYNDPESPPDDKQLPGGIDILRARRNKLVMTNIGVLAPAHVLRAVDALQWAGFVSEVATVLNRAPLAVTLEGGEVGDSILPDALPWYPLDFRGKVGFTPEGEEGVCGLTAATASEFGMPVAREGGRFESVYCAFVPSGYGAMIAGLWRPRFRPTSPANAGVVEAWKNILHRRDAGYELICAVRAKAGLEHRRPPWEGAEKARRARRQAVEGGDRSRIPNGHSV